MAGATSLAALVSKLTDALFARYEMLSIKLGEANHNLW